MTTYSVGFSQEELSALALKADVYLKGNQISYISKSNKESWNQDKLGELFSYSEEIWKMQTDTNKIILKPGDTVLLDYVNPYCYIYLMREDDINVIVIGHSEKIVPFICQ